MAAIDVSDLLEDPDFASALAILRRSELVGDNGRTVITETAILPAPMGVVMPKDSVIGGNAIERAPDMQYRGAALLCYTKFRLRGPSLDANGQEWQPDVVVWNGNRYVVTLINDYAHFGQGYIQAELSSMDGVDEPPAEEGQ